MTTSSSMRAALAVAALGGFPILPNQPVSKRRSKPYVTRAQTQNTPEILAHNARVDAKKAEKEARKNESR